MSKKLTLRDYIVKAHNDLMMAYVHAGPSGLCADALRRAMGNCGQALNYMPPPKLNKMKRGKNGKKKKISSD